MHAPAPAWPRTVIVALALALSACAGEDVAPAGIDHPTGAPTDPGTHAASPQLDQEDRSVQITIRIGNQVFGAHLEDSDAARDLLAQLPITLQMRDHGGVEKTGRLSGALSLKGQPSGADPDVGDVGYYAPGQDLVLYYGDQSYYEGIVVLGRMDEGAAHRIAELEGTVAVTVTAAGE